MPSRITDECETSSKEFARRGSFREAFTRRPCKKKKKIEKKGGGPTFVTCDWARRYVGSPKNAY